jgi:myosin heavy subunit
MLKLEEAGVIDNDQVAKAHGYKKARVSSEDKEAKKADEMKQQLAAKTKTLKEQYNPNEPRDEIGRWTDGGASGGDAKKESFSEMMDRIKHEREASQKKWEDAGWSHTEEARLKELSDLDANGHLQGVRNEKAQNELSELRGKKQHLKSKKLLGSNTGVIKGSLKQIKLADIDLMGQRLDEVAPLHDGNSGMPIILAKHGDKFKLLDGYGRTNGMLNAGHTKIHAIVASDADIDKFSGATSDNDEFVQYMYDKYTKGLTAGSQGSLLKAA